MKKVLLSFILLVALSLTLSSFNVKGHATSSSQPNDVDIKIESALITKDNGETVDVSPVINEVSSEVSDRVNSDEFKADIAKKLSAKEDSVEIIDLFDITVQGLEDDEKVTITFTITGDINNELAVVHERDGEWVSAKIKSFNDGKAEVEFDGLCPVAFLSVEVYTDANPLIWISIAVVIVVAVILIILLTKKQENKNMESSIEDVKAQVEEDLYDETQVEDEISLDNKFEEEPLVQEEQTEELVQEEIKEEDQEEIINNEEEDNNEEN